MEIVVIKGGKFTMKVDEKAFAKGLRPDDKVRRNTEFASELSGAVGQTGSLSVLESITRLATTLITDAFPFPQVFVLTTCVLVCGLTKIYEYDLVTDTMALKYTASQPGGVWKVADYHDYVILSNGRISVTRSAADKTITLSELPSATAVCDFNKQLIIGAPNVRGLVANLMIAASAITITLTTLGTRS